MKFQRIEAKERNACTVRALQNALGIEYQDAYDCLKAVGRKHRCGFPITKVMQVIRNRSITPVPKTYKRLVDSGEYETGRYIVRVSQHVFAIRDGVVYDHSPVPPRTRILEIYRLGE